MNEYENIHTETISGFDIVFSVAPEIDSPDWDFENDQQKNDLLDSINRGDLSWFVARVQAYKNGILLSTDYLGGCCYKSPMDFVNSKDYYTDMVQNVIIDAKSAINKLCN